MVSIKLHHFTLDVNPGAMHRNRYPVATVINMNFLLASPYSLEYLQKPKHYIFLHISSPTSCPPLNFFKCPHATYKRILVSILKVWQRVPVLNRESSIRIV
jgi:hypothetical protein